MRWKNTLIQLARRADDALDEAMRDWKAAYGKKRPLQIVPYRSYGTADSIYVRGRVLMDKQLAKAASDDSVWENLLNMYKRLETDEVPNVPMHLTINGEDFTTLTDKEGYFKFEVNPEQPIISEELYFGLEVYCTEPQPARATAEIMIPPIDAEYGIISDIDDTIIRSSATDLLAMSKTILLRNAYTRLPFAGVTAFYKALQIGRNGKRNNPFFYVSSSPWNLYDLLRDFMDLHEIPGGPLLLRDFGLQSDTFIHHDYLDHKFNAIANILKTYPQLPFVLIGDSGEKDPGIYAEVVKQFPGRILAVYIRDMEVAKKKAIALEAAATMQQHGATMMLTPDSVQASRHAADMGLILHSAIEGVKDERAQQEAEG